MISLHPTITMADVIRIAEYLDCKLVQDMCGNIVITPRRSAHTNANVHKFPRHKRQIMHADLPTDPGPEAA
ncbi:MAG: hypothetical protein KDI55_02340 [Anaerolineae bacterium]|nr:hypothetical protein [Anaerolineae bacterium]MCP5428576.1 hypothetical protein [Chromatiaceae bacterium]